MLKWSGDFPVPAIGQAVHVNFNGLGAGVVESYFTEHGYLGLTVKLAAPPDWHRKQTKGHWYAGKALIFGKEIMHPEAYDRSAYQPMVKPSFE
jgi:hypothetical protein